MAIRPVLYGAGTVVVIGIAALAVRGSERVTRGPAFIPNPDVAPPVETRRASVRIVSNGVPADSIVLDAIAPTKPVRLLFFQGRSVQPDHVGGGISVDGAGGILRISPKLTVTRLTPRVDGRLITSVAAAADNGLWLVSGDGEIGRVDRHGEVIAPFTAGPFMYAVVASDATGRAFVVRSPDRTGFRPVFGSTPLIARLDQGGSPEKTLGNGVIPADFLLTHLASSGRIAVTDTVVFYAPFIRDEVVALSTTGDTLWVAHRGLPQARPEPRFEVIDGEPMIDYAPVNLAIAIGPDDHLYVVSVPGFTTESARLDVFDAATGHLLRSTTVDTPLPTLAADAEGRVYRIDEFALLTGVAPGERQTFSTFELETLSGGRMTSSDLVGRVTLVNFWASWCAPCRVEMPALDSLRRSITNPEFQFITMNEDVRESNARAFIDDYGFDFPVLMGKGDLKAKYHYVGLPYTVLLDRSGKIVERWIGYAGEEQMAGIRAIVTAELDRVSTGDAHTHPEQVGADAHGHNR